MNTDALSTTIAALADSLSSACQAGIRVDDATLDMPVEANVVRDHAGAQLVIVQPPRWRWRSGFDCEPGRLRVKFAPLGAES